VLEVRVKENRLKKIIHYNRGKKKSTFFLPTYMANVGEVDEDT
jgi:hypothetical protein